MGKFTQVNVFAVPVLIMYACALRMSCKCRAELQPLLTMGLIIRLAIMHFECVYVHVCVCACECV